MRRAVDGLIFLLLAVSAVTAACGPQALTSKAIVERDDPDSVEFTTAGSLVLAEDGHLVPGPALTLSGELQTPDGSGPFPGIVLMHGCAGVGAAERGWEAALRSAGYATFVVDSLGGRGLGEACVDARALLPAQRIPDAYEALGILSNHSLIDAQRIALMGFSHGGTAATLSATTWARDRFSTPGQPRFRAFIAFYPYCNWTFPEMRHLSAPLRIHAGALDDWTPAKACERMAADLRAAGTMPRSRCIREPDTASTR